MQRVLKELDKFRSSDDADAVHDLRVAIRRCRSLGAVMEEVDPDPAWPEMRKAARKLFRGLGSLRDTQVMIEWVKKLAPDSDPVRAHLQPNFEAAESPLREEALRLAGKFEEKTWKNLERHLRQRVRLVPAGGLAAECLALERLEEARELHARALRTDRPKPWHALRIGVKRFRYTVEGLLPEQYAQWSDNLKRIQDLLGDLHDLDVLSVTVEKAEAIESEESHSLWRDTIIRERNSRIETYRQLTLGHTSLWNGWRAGLPTNGRLEAASMARLRATARAVDPRPRRTSQVSRIALGLFDALRRVGADPLFSAPQTRRVLRAAARLHGVGAALDHKAPQKAARNFLRELPLPCGWSSEEWELLAWTVRYHRGAEPKPKHKGFAELPTAQQNRVRALAGVLRLGRALRKDGIESGAGFRGENSPQAITLRIPALNDSAETSARVAAAKHLLESFLGRPVILLSAPVVAKLVALPSAAPTALPAASD
jgi:CHAD domain-containing protein